MNDKYDGPSEFIHLHLHTLYSFLDGVSSPEQYIETCGKRGYRAIATTEHGHMASVPDMYISGKKHKVKTITGCEIYLNDYEPIRQNLVKQGIKIRDKEWKRENIDLYNRIVRNRHLTVICKNEIGFNNLIKLTTQAYETGLFGMGRQKYNRIWFDKLCEFKEGLIILSGCLNGPICHELRNTHIIDRQTNDVIWERSRKEAVSDAVKEIKKYKSIFGDDYYIELQMPLIKAYACSTEIDDYKVFKDLISLSDHFKIKPVLSNDAHYMERKDFELQKIMMAISQGTTVGSPDLFHVNSSEQYFKTRSELWATFQNNQYSNGIDNTKFEEICDNTIEIADKCEKIDFDTSPKIPDIKDADRELIQLTCNRLQELNLKNDTRKFVIDGNEVTHAQQAGIELKRLIEKGYASYMLITYDLIKYGKSQGWPFMPRGSGGGSLVCYLLGISNYDPLLFGLSFDRFLAPSRGGYLLKVTMDK